MSGDPIRESVEKKPKSLSDAKMKKLIPMYVKGKPGSDHKCGTCKFRIMPQGCELVKGEINMKDGTCAFWALGPPAGPEDERSYKMSKSLSGYTETPGEKINCSTCQAYHDRYCNLWEDPVGPGDCCLVWENEEIEK